MKLSGELVAHKTGPSGTAVRIIGDSGRKIASDSVEGRPITQRISAPPRENESNTMEVCQILRERLNQERTPNRAPWSDVELIEKHDSDVDALLCNETEELPVQVTRPDLNGKWQTISAGGTVETSHEIDHAAEEIRRAIAGKKFTQQPSSEPRDRAELRRRRERLQKRRSRLNQLVLAIDCIETPTFVLAPAVTDYFDSAWGAWARTLGFTSIWLVGATPTLTRKIK